MHDIQQSTEVAEDFLNSSSGLHFEVDQNMFNSLLPNSNYDEFPLVAQSPFSSGFQNAFSPSPKSADIFLDNTLSTLFQNDNIKTRDFASTSQASSLNNPSSVGSIDSGNYSYNDTLMTSFADENLTPGGMSIDDCIFRSLEDADCVFDLNIFGGNNSRFFS